MGGNGLLSLVLHMAMKAPAWGGHARDDSAELALKEFSPQFEGGEDTEKTLAQSNKG